MPRAGRAGSTPCYFAEGRGGSVGRGLDVSVGRGIGVGVPFGVGVGVGVTVGVTVGVGVGVGPDSAQYLPPVFKRLPEVSVPPQTIISVPVHTAVCSLRSSGALTMLVAVQTSLPGLYRWPVFVNEPTVVPPAETII